MIRMLTIIVKYKFFAVITFDVQPDQLSIGHTCQAIIS